MTMTNNIFVAVIVVLTLMVNQSTICTADYKPDPNAMTKWGPKLNEEELSAIAKLPVQELVEMLKTGEALQAYAALSQLKSEAHGGIEKNFDLLLNIAAETRGNMIVEGLLKPLKSTASTKEKLRVDKLLDFLENELKKDNPRVSRRQAVRSIARTVFPPPGIRYFGRPFRHSSDPNMLDPNNWPVPYANDRVVNILTSCLDKSDRRVREVAIRWLGNVGANRITNANNVVAILNTQLTKERARKEKEQIKAETKTEKDILDSLKQLNRNINASLMKKREGGGYWDPPR